MEFKFAIGDIVGTLGDTTCGPVIERVWHEFAGAVRIKYYYHARIKLPNGEIVPRLMLDGYEHELKRLEQEWPEWCLPKFVPTKAED
jgi:hypothetical protein